LERVFEVCLLNRVFEVCLADIGTAGDNIGQGNCLSKFSNLMGFLDAFKAVFGVANCLLRRRPVLPSFGGVLKTRTRNLRRFRVRRFRVAPE
jgi:hypothetical protein